MSESANTAKNNTAIDADKLRRKYLEERDRRLRPEGTDQYVDIKNFGPIDETLQQHSEIIVRLRPRDVVRVRAIGFKYSVVRP